MIKVTLHITEALAKARRALASRYLFDNWFSLLIKYALIKIGFNVKLTAKVDTCVFELSPETFGYLVNRASRGLIRLKCNDRKVVMIYTNGIQVTAEEFRKGDTYDIDLAIENYTYDIDLAIENGWAYDLANKYWTKDNVKFRNMHWPIFEVFDFGNYEGVDVNGKVVIDVGAFVGDTAIYFLLKGAKKVIAIEPLPANYEELLDNIHLNGMEERIIPINAMVNSEHMIVEIPRNVPVSIRSSSIDMYKKHGISKLIDIESITLSDLINEHAINGDNAVLKMDCEGCEYDIILNDYEHVKLFKEVIFEYHAYVTNRSVTELISAMNKDFSCQLMNEEFYKKILQ